MLYVYAVDTNSENDKIEMANSNIIKRWDGQVKRGVVHREWWKLKHLPGVYEIKTVLVLLISDDSVSAE